MVCMRIRRLTWSIRLDFSPRILQGLLGATGDRPARPRAAHRPAAAHAGAPFRALSGAVSRRSRPKSAHVRLISRPFECIFMLSPCVFHAIFLQGFLKPFLAPCASPQVSHLCDRLAQLADEQVSQQTAIAHLTDALIEEQAFRQDFEEAVRQEIKHAPCLKDAK